MDPRETGSTDERVNTKVRQHVNVRPCVGVLAMAVEADFALHEVDRSPEQTTPADCMTEFLDDAYRASEAFDAGEVGAARHYAIAAAGWVALLLEVTRK